ncbi:MAG: ParB/RepB/Spo0J family partition protein [Elusimicrobiales bacterium]|nr:ParB/RepB/Spo0J family partition protein [Elusimicrobiales bacterium]MCK5583490.1 ParB/RepB/Spo0J family partition protein [Elusimicrobiales bacterium]
MRQALGKGIDALISKVNSDEAKKEALQKISINKIKPNRYQPRKIFKDESLEELSQSIKKDGLIQPITVCSVGNGSYELIAGERRWRASKLAGVKQIDAIVRKNLSNEQNLALSLIENLQREDLNAIDEGLGYKRLMEEFNVNQSEIAKYCNKSKSAVSNTLRLLDLDDDIKKAVQSELISEGHARALLSIGDAAKRKEAYYLIISDKWSVREVENYVRNNSPKRENKKSKVSKINKTPEIIEYESNLEKYLGTKVEIQSGDSPESGKIIIKYCSLDDFDRIYNILSK